MRTEGCACGGEITAPNLGASAPAVLEHNLDSQHQDWRRQGGAEAWERIGRRRPASIQWSTFDPLSTGPEWDAYEHRRMTS